MSNVATLDSAGPADQPAQPANARPAGTLFAGVVIGGALAYLFDPDRGARRRAILRSEIASLFRSASRDLNARSRDLKNRAQGVGAETRMRISDEAVNDDQLAARVRAELGHHVDRARPIEVAAEGGRVILRGRAPESEIEAVVVAARGVRGVRDVDNRLQPPLRSSLFSSEVDWPATP